VSDREETEEATLHAYRRLLERSAAALAEATAVQHEADPPLDPPPCP
jgi:hypothetical protein